MKKLISILVITLSICAVSYAQTDNKPANNVSVTIYSQLLEKLKAGDTKIDYKAIRVAFTDTKEFSPLGAQTDYKLFAMVEKKKFKDAIKVAAEKLESNYVDIDAHLVCAISYAETKNQAKADFHKAVYLGLINSILSGADGKGAKTAFVVLSIGEENSVLRALGLIKADQALINENGKKFDVIGVTDAKTKEASKVYFNIDLLWKGYDNMFSK